MSKEELEKEAAEFEESNTVYQAAKREDGTDYAKKVCKVTIKEAYLAAAEPREKRIAELNDFIMQSKEDGISPINALIIMTLEKRIAELEKENAELKESGSVICDRLSERIDEIVELKNENIGLKNQLTEKVTLESLDIVSAKINGLEKENAELKAQIEKMKCGNKHNNTDFKTEMYQLLFKE